MSAIIDKFTQNDFLTAAKTIKPNFEIHFENNIKPLGIHLRGTDRINKKMRHPHFMKSEKQFNDLIDRTIFYVNKTLPQSLFICSDDIQYKNLLLSRLDKRIKVVDPVAENDIPEEYTNALEYYKEQQSEKENWENQQKSFLQNRGFTFEEIDSVFS